MARAVNPTPKTYPGVAPYLCVSDAPGAIAFYKRAFGAEERMRLTMPDGTIAHAEITIGKAAITRIKNMTPKQMQKAMAAMPAP